ncbi:uncharacterized protein FIBRA_05403 [Fibroporia radiculosa]|uniref:Peptidase C14 caspase domain-containing protein n=1 Tax=Fibroporia radiculosa TaxID=599839 RepID=J4GQX9_9APHY|nr:uncharacterized protein FIBRA_05403 [Fibroporia radiculosa]CCM03275.1 predicted protein [Fibroporia radiculosa]
MPVPTSNSRPPLRRALSIAVQYSQLKQYEMDLVGTHNDPRILSDLLVDVFKYKREDITILMDDENNDYPWPTRENIEKAMKELVADAQPGDHFVFHFSGHGALVRNTDGTERSGYDEVIWPVDIRYENDDGVDNYIMDDEIHDVLVNHIPVGAHFMMVFDCCHSGSAADLPNTSEDCQPPTPVSAASSTMSLPSSEAVKNIRVRGTQEISAATADDAPQRSTSKDVFHPAAPLADIPVKAIPEVADVTSWAACEDDQVTFGSSKGGIFVNALARALRRRPTETHAELLSSVTREISKITAHINLHKSASEALPVPKPELESLESMNEIYNKPLDL